MIQLNTSFLRTVNGILKIAECVCIFILLLIIRFGGSNYSALSLGSVNNSFVGQGTVVGFAIIVPAILVTYLLGGSVSILELVINLVGGLLFLVVGGLAIAHNGQAANGSLFAVGMFSIVTGLVFLADLGWLIKNTKFTFITRVEGTR
eukprot:TRINITY_DN30400_c0_g1_i1.p1 TRINITY_DN30400_c0_g1~~TRINITY_DN30400_c0_g1_i1.p1  ORF type:complete len:148 (-),score=32.27 TRINITY_DN30400_c0_g1_i1:95-538(-)